jgi:hypothetical protein
MPDSGSGPVVTEAMATPVWRIRVCPHGYQLVYIAEIGRWVHGNTDGVPCDRSDEADAVDVVAALSVDRERDRLVGENAELRRLLWRSVNRRQSPRLTREIEQALSSSPTEREVRE